MTSRDGWEADEDWLEDGDDDLGDDPPSQPAPSPSPVSAPPPQPPRPHVHRERPAPKEKPPGRILKVKAMSKGMQTKWPDVTSCLLTLSNGRQVMFVKG